MVVELEVVEEVKANVEDESEVEMEVVRKTLQTIYRIRDIFEGGGGNGGDGGDGTGVGGRRWKRKWTGRRGSQVDNAASS